MFEKLSEDHCDWESGNVERDETKIVFKIDKIPSLTFVLFSLGCYIKILSGL